MKKILTATLLIFLFLGFTTYLKVNNQAKTVMSVITPTKLSIDINNNKIPGHNENICIEGIEVFPLDSGDELYNKYSKSLNLSKKDIISLGFLAQEFAQKNLLNRKVSVKLSNDNSTECRFAQININGLDYKTILANSGYGIINGEIANIERFKTNLQTARKLNLVRLNHHSNKYHTLDCPYGNIAHDTVLIPQKDLPKNAKACKFCHQEKLKSTKQQTIVNIVQPPLNVTNGDIKIYYTDFTKTLIPNKNCSTKVCKELVNLIENTKDSIDIAIYGYDEIPAITTALTNAKTRGVDINFVYDENFDPTRTYYRDNSIISNLAKQSRSDKTENQTQSNMLMHNKFIIFDKKTIFTGSMNLSRTGLSGYDINDVIIINSPEIATLYLKEFEQMLSGKFHKLKNKITTNNKFKLGNSEIEVYFSPKDNTSNRIIELIKSAKTYIYIPTFLITHNKIAQELIIAKQRGVDVRIIIDANSTSTRNTKHAILRKSGVLLKTENYAGKLHSKTMIIDDKYLISGSMNFSNSGENKNDENLLVIKDNKIAKHHKDFFLYLWTSIPNKYMHSNAKPESHDSIGSCFDGIDNNFNGLIDRAEKFCK